MTTSSINLITMIYNHMPHIVKVARNL
uniref:Uncharacterized protein n=1 Tax=Arundo donax TaxID=35708 RepID=A0A0A9C584_ARUDO